MEIGVTVNVIILLTMDSIVFITYVFIYTAPVMFLLNATQLLGMSRFSKTAKRKNILVTSAAFLLFSVGLFVAMYEHGIYFLEDHLRQYLIVEFILIIFSSTVSLFIRYLIDKVTIVHVLVQILLVIFVGCFILQYFI